MSHIGLSADKTSIFIFRYRRSTLALNIYAWHGILRVGGRVTIHEVKDDGLSIRKVGF